MSSFCDRGRGDGKNNSVALAKATRVEKSYTPISARDDFLRLCRNRERSNKVKRL